MGMSWASAAVDKLRARGVTMAGGPQPYQNSAAAQALGLMPGRDGLPGGDRLPGLGTDLAADAEEAMKIRRRKMETMDPMQSPAAAMLLGGVK